MDSLSTRSQLKALIPDHCFRPSAVRSCSYLAFDLVAIGVIGGVLAYLHRTDAHHWALHWPLIGLLGTFCWSLFVIGHEAGHGAFSQSHKLNTAIGIVVHGALLVPYRGWQRSHARHHRATGHLAREEVFRAPTEPESPIRRTLIRSGLFLLLGWPLYLLGFRNQDVGSIRDHNHFTTRSDLYHADEHVSFVASVAACTLFAVLYGALGIVFGPAFFLNYLLAPYLMFCAWLTFVTYMHHVDPHTPIYPDDQWSPLHGALATVDRNYWPFNWLTHRIGDQHVIHHLFPGIPHYHATEAMAAIEPVLGERRLRRDGSVIADFARNLRNCQTALPVGKGEHWRWSRDAPPPRSTPAGADA